ncbi:single-stranded DNA-binding protein [Delftia sp. GW456-R20]|uniref:single-stranded DNA-binding protein n=1 Tax=Delftia sp. GW456-R20 TaxID=1827145 RepID=UPI0009EE37C3|nr:single-stranded DNA-binding protein [Delftia sp. GW456-R20]
MNETQLIGRLGHNPQITRVGGTVIANMSIATAEYWRDGQGEGKKHTEWHEVVCYDGLASLVENYLRSGDEVWIAGNLRTKQWMDESGKKIKSTKIRVKALRMLRVAPDKDRVRDTLESLAAIIEQMQNPIHNFTLNEFASMVDSARGKLAGEF